MPRPLVETLSALLDADKKAVAEFQRKLAEAGYVIMSADALRWEEVDNALANLRHTGMDG